MKDKRLSNLKPFKPGQSGNPAGMKKGVRLTKAFERELAKHDKKSGCTYSELIAGTIISEAVKGNLDQAINAITFDNQELIKAAAEELLFSGVCTRKEALQVLKLFVALRGNN